MTYILFDVFNAIHRYCAVVKSSFMGEGIVDVGGNVFERYYKLIKQLGDARPVLILDDVEKKREHPLDESFLRSLKTLQDLFNALGFSVVAQKGKSGDELIGWCVGLLGAENYIYIDSGDKDFAQLVSSNVFLARYDKEYTLWGPSEVYKKWGALPGQFVDYLALVGDASDDIKGVMGVGPKTAETLLKDHGSIEAFIRWSDRVAHSLPKKLETVVEEWFNGGIERRQNLLRISLDYPEGFCLTQPTSDMDLACKLLGKAKLSEICYRLMENGAL